MPETIFWEIVGSGAIDQSQPLSLGNISSSPGSTTAIELKVYFTTTGQTSKLINCGLFASVFTMFYNSVPGKSAMGDYQELKSWGDQVGQTNQCGLLVNMNKSGDYPDGSWLPFSSVSGISQFSPIVLAKEAVQLNGGGYHNTDGEIPSGATAYMKVKVASPIGASIGERFFSMVLDYEPYGS